MAQLGPSRAVSCSTSMETHPLCLHYPFLAPSSGASPRPVWELTTRLKGVALPQAPILVPVACPGVFPSSSYSIHPGCKCSQWAPVWSYCVLPRSLTGRV